MNSWVLAAVTAIASLTLQFRANAQTTIVDAESYFCMEIQNRSTGAAVVQSTCDGRQHNYSPWQNNLTVTLCFGMVIPKGVFRLDQSRLPQPER